MCLLDLVPYIPWGIFMCTTQHLTLFGFTWETPSSTFMINTIAYSFVAGNGPKSFTKLKCFDSHYRPQCVLFITNNNNKNMEPEV